MINKKDKYYDTLLTAKALSRVNSQGEKSQTGSYTNTHEPGKQQAKTNNDALKSTNWTKG